MAKKKICLSAEKIAGFVRGTVGIDELMDKKYLNGNADITCREGYSISFDDLTAGLKTHYEAETDVYTFFNEWFGVIYWDLGDVIHLPEMLGSNDLVEDLELDEYSTGMPFFDDVTHLALYVVSTLDYLEGDLWEADKEALHGELGELLEIISNYRTNAGLPKENWTLTVRQKKAFVGARDDERIQDGLPDWEVRLFKKYLEELAAADDTYGLKVLGYCYYGDDCKLYPCDWVKSRDCFLRLIEIADDELQGQAANTLGYIYYYGRCNGGEPQYDEAYRYFSLAAFFGYFEAKYKVGDMLASGKGTPKNQTAAYNLYSQVYQETHQSFLSGHAEYPFASAALRMGSCYQHGSGTYKNLMLSYGFYLKARLAMDEYMKKHEFFGAGTVAAGIKKGLQEVKEELGDECMQRQVWLYFPDFLQERLFNSDNVVFRAELSEGKVSTSLKLTRVSCYDFDHENPLVLTFPEISYCKRTAVIKLKCNARAVIENRAEKKTFLLDSVKCKKGQVHFYYQKKMVLSVWDEGWYIKAEKYAVSNEMHKFVSVRFTPTGRLYDYLADGLDVQEGGEVMIPSMDGIKKMKVVKVFEQSAAEAALDIDKYKKAEMPE